MNIKKKQIRLIGALGLCFIVLSFIGSKAEDTKTKDEPIVETKEKSVVEAATKQDAGTCKGRSDQETREKLARDYSKATAELVFSAAPVGKNKKHIITNAFQLIAIIDQICRLDMQLIFMDARLSEIVSRLDRIETKLNERSE
ncbi:MAG: hypothetical protein LBM19_01030 [Holosporales bacterium]|nr:hypothetical protein [Holosporales bacterium]